MMGKTKRKGEGNFMNKFMQNQIIRNLGSTLLFGVCYAIFMLIGKKTIDIENLVITLITYFVVMNIIYVVVPKIKKKNEQDKK